MEAAWRECVSEVWTTGDCGTTTKWSSVRRNGQGKPEIPEKKNQPTASSGTIPSCKNPVNRLGIEPGSPWWEASVLIAQPPRPLLCVRSVAVMYPLERIFTKRGKFIPALTSRIIVQEFLVYPTQAHETSGVHVKTRYGRLLTARSREPMRVIEVSMERHRNEEVGEVGDP
ncbi:hypothetical protein PR048_030629 [Dryococelus australis]|uniref:Uncharacterized protein n=1 Tax=Dryococelus australis TaxID=614101 RepID=A0ABQ9GCA2_9NEOP|nr:hypothetical protein PR048_030629 [Dryococelus australis]